MKIIKGRKNVRKLVFSELPNGSISFEAQYKSMKGYFHPVIVILEKKDLERAEEMRRCIRKKEIDSLEYFYGQ